MTPEKARELAKSTELPYEVIEIIKFIEQEIERYARLRRDHIDLTQFIPSCSRAGRGVWLFEDAIASAWFIAMDEFRKRGFKVTSNYLGKAYSINGHYYSYGISW